MRSQVAKRILDNTPKDVKIFVKFYTDLVVHINQLLENKGFSQKQLADNLHKQPSEINKWLSHEHNFTLKSIAKIQAELDQPLIVVPCERTKVKYTVGSHKIKFKSYRTLERKSNDTKLEYRSNGQNTPRETKTANEAA